MLKKLFGGAAKADQPPAAPEHTEYKGFLITPMPISEGGQFRISARIEKTVNGEDKTHTLIRADVLRDEKEAKEASVNKAKQMIDQMGDHLF
nr:HlyU family transcriptional regulator [Shimia sp. R10_1]